MTNAHLCLIAQAYALGYGGRYRLTLAELRDYRRQLREIRRARWPASVCGFPRERAIIAVCDAALHEGHRGRTAIRVVACPCDEIGCDGGRVSYCRGDGEYPGERECESCDGEGISAFEFYEGGDLHLGWYLGSLSALEFPRTAADDLAAALNREGLSGEAVEEAIEVYSETGEVERAIRAGLAVEEVDPILIRWRRYFGWGEAMDSEPRPRRQRRQPRCRETPFRLVELYRGRVIISDGEVYMRSCSETRYPSLASIRSAIDAEAQPSRHPHRGREEK